MNLRGHLWAAAWLLLATAACFSRLMQYPTDLFVGPQDRGLNDVTRQVLAYRTLLRTEVHRSDQVPLWNPWAMGGAAWYGNPLGQRTLRRRAFRAHHADDPARRIH